MTPLSDLYSLGAMLYEMLTGRSPFMGDDSIGIIEQHIHTPPVAPTWHNLECPKALEALIIRLLGKNPSERPASATEVLLALEAIDLLGQLATLLQQQDQFFKHDSSTGVSSLITKPKAHHLGPMWRI